MVALKDILSGTYSLRKRILPVLWAFVYRPELVEGIAHGSAVGFRREDCFCYSCKDGEFILMVYVPSPPRWGMR
jgi:hypothetical protein